MYPIFLFLHSWFRWIVLVLIVVAVVRALIGFSKKKSWSSADSKVSLWLVISMDIQFLLGLGLYLVFSPLTQAAFRNFGAAMGQASLRFWAVEHAFLMLLALVSVHVGKVLVKKAKADQSRHKRALIFYGISLLLILAVMPWPNLPYGRPFFRLLGGG